MATTPKTPPLTTGTTSPASRYTVTPTSTAALGAAQSAIKQATGTAPPKSFTVGSTMSVAQSTPGGKFVQGSTTTPAANKAVSSSAPPANTGTTQSNILQSILGIAPLAAVGLSVYNKVSQGVSFTSTISNFTNAVSSLFSVKSDQAPAETARLARQNAAVTPAAPVSTAGEAPSFRTPGAAHVDAPAPNSTANETPSFRTPGGAHVDAPAPNSTANETPSFRTPGGAHVDAPAPNSTANETPSFRTPGAAHVDAPAPPDPNQDPAETARLARSGNADANNYVENFNPPPADEFAGIDQQVAEQQLINNNYIENFAPPPADEFAGIDAQVAANAADQAAIDKAKSISNVQDPSQRAQARENVENYKAPPVDENDAEVARLARSGDATADNNYVENFNPPPTDEFAGLDANNYVENFDNPTDPNYVETFDPAGDPNYIENFDNPTDPNYVETFDPAGDPNYIENFDNPTDPNYVENFDNPTDPNYIENFDPPPTDEFDGIDAQVDANNYVESFDPDLSNRGGLTDEEDARAEQTQQTAQRFEGQEDWRVRLSLAPGANYLYKVEPKMAGILNPLQATDGVIFPYTPAISIAYSAAYEATDLTHSNYKFFSYKNSSVDNISITADFTAQDTTEAQYLLAVIHFFRSVTKMFYGKDQTPRNGTPPPLCYLRGLGSFQFNWHPLVITNFTYTLPTDVDYIRVMDTTSRPGVNVGPGKFKGPLSADITTRRLQGAGIQPGGLAAAPVFNNNNLTGYQDSVTYVPTKMQITLAASPIVSRNDVSNNFSLDEYATNDLYPMKGFW